MRCRDGDPGPLHDWDGLDEEGLRAYAATHVGWATNEMSDPADLRWTMERMPLDAFDALAVDWRRWHLEEVAPNPRCAWMEEGTAFHTPVVVSVEMGEIVIWDGWHRIAHAKARGDGHVTTIVSRVHGRS